MGVYSPVKKKDFNGFLGKNEKSCQKLRVGFYINFFWENGS